jgi:DNA replication protein DnaC
MRPERIEDLCPNCHGSGWQPVGNTDGQVRRCHCWEARHRAAAGVPIWCRAVCKKSMQSSIVNAGILRDTLKWLESSARPRPDVYFHGPTGTGKTTMSVMLLNELHARRVATFFIGVRKFLQTHLDAMDLPDLKREAHDLHRRACSVEVLVLDDLGAERNSDYSRSVLTCLLDERLAAGCSTIWTSNLDISRLSRFYADDRLPSRIVGACAGHIFEFQGEDHRLSLRRPGGIVRTRK